MYKNFNVDFKNEKLYKKTDKCYMYFDHVLYKNKHYH